MSRARVLVAEDDPTMRTIVAAVIRKMGHEVIEVPDGGRLLVALAKAVRNDEAPDLIVSDILMPVMSGLAMAVAMHERYPRIPLVLMTAFPDHDVERQVRNLGAVLLGKPFEVAELERIVVAAIGKGQ